MKYHFDLVCPRCNKTSETVVEQPAQTPAPDVNCGDCLMNDVEVVRMKVVKVTEAVA